MPMFRAHCYRRPLKWVRWFKGTEWQTTGWCRDPAPPTPPPSRISPGRGCLMSHELVLVVSATTGSTTTTSTTNTTTSSYHHHSPVGIIILSAQTLTVDPFLPRTFHQCPYLTHDLTLQQPHFLTYSHKSAFSSSTISAITHRCSWCTVGSGCDDNRRWRSMCCMWREPVCLGRRRDTVPFSHLGCLSPRDRQWPD